MTACEGGCWFNPKSNYCDDCACYTGHKAQQEVCDHDNWDMVWVDGLRRGGQCNDCDAMFEPPSILDMPPLYPNGDETPESDQTIPDRVRMTPENLKAALEVLDEMAAMTPEEFREALESVSCGHYNWIPQFGPHCPDCNAVVEYP